MRYSSIISKFTFSLILYFIACIVSVYVLLLFAIPFYRSDFFAFYTAGTVIHMHVHELYSPEYQQITQSLLLKKYTPQIGVLPDPLPFVNPLPLGLIFVPFTIFAPSVGYRIAQGVFSFIFLLSLLWARKLFGIRNSWIFFLMSFSFTPVFIALFQTQTAIITFILFLGLFVSFVARRQFLSGILLSLFIVKPQFLIPLVIFYFARRQWKILSVFLLCSMMLLGIWYLTAPTHISSYPNFLSWYVSQFENVPNGADKMISIQGLLYQVHAFFPSFPPYAISVFASMLVLGIAARYWYTIHDDTIEVF